jgi:2-oxoisovalerate dehydrogenase E2 component (dihydrolipoyl transacylase)
MIKLPDVGEGIAEAEIVAWHVNVGDAIAEDDVLVDVMTDKATVELPSPVQGTVTWLAGDAGDIIRIGADLIGIEVDGRADVDELPAPTLRPVEDHDASEATNAGQPIETAESTKLPESAEPIRPPQPTEPARPAPLAASAPAAGDQRGASPEPATGPADDAVEGNGHRPTGERPLASPAVRRRAKALRIDLARVAGSGPDQRIEHEDLDALIARGTALSASPAPRRVATTPAPTAQDADDDVVEDVKIIGLRRNIAQRMQLSKRKIPHFTYVEEVDVTELEKVRESLNRRVPDQPVKLTLLPFLVRAMVVALEDFPQLNARFNDDDGIVQRHRAVHAGIAVQTPKGLMVPVLKNAHRRDLWDSAAEIARLSNAARSARITVAELTGSTITITSLGAFGGIVSTPVINYPEVAVIGVNKIQVKPVYEDAVIVPRHVMNLSSSFDHRVIDGWDAAQFIQRIRTLLETPALLFVAPTTA